VKTPTFIMFLDMMAPAAQHRVNLSSINVKCRRVFIYSTDQYRVFDLSVPFRILEYYIITAKGWQGCCNCCLNDCDWYREQPAVAQSHLNEWTDPVYQGCTERTW